MTHGTATTGTFILVIQGQARANIENGKVKLPWCNVEWSHLSTGTRPINALSFCKSFRQSLPVDFLAMLRSVFLLFRTVYDISV